MRQCLSLLLLLLVFTRGYGQEKKTISGYIKDASNGETLIGVSVYVREISNGTVSNDYGYYALNLTTGNTYTLVFNYLGYECSIHFNSPFVFCRFLHWTNLTTSGTKSQALSTLQDLRTLRNAHRAFLET